MGSRGWRGLHPEAGVLRGEGETGQGVTAQRSPRWEARCAPGTEGESDNEEKRKAEDGDRAQTDPQEDWSGWHRDCA